jgi:hypothetical protein
MIFVDHGHADVRCWKTTVGSRIFAERQSTESLRILKAFDQFRTGMISRAECPVGIGDRRSGFAGRPAPAVETDGDARLRVSGHRPGPNPSRP